MPEEGVDRVLLERRTILSRVGVQSEPGCSSPFYLPTYLPDKAARTGQHEQVELERGGAIDRKEGPRPLEAYACEDAGRLGFRFVGRD